ncbi:hypothetical protein [Klebsiella pneumoniae]|nr:hypothetical protein [Klebsiella pneumoniae]
MSDKENTEQQSYQDGCSVFSLSLIVITMSDKENTEQQSYQDGWRQNQNHHASTQAVVGHAVPLWENIDIIVLCSVAAPRGAAALNELVLFD